ncbi:hypothetical protein HJB99_08290 [Rhizobium sp. NLR17b]|uniref:hypothetical protein n=1 Tax=Rhizobium sp. NLR17b TaxID=2731114 RepID=UPI001C8390E5|nr:hypothetical protein [Rhizobium sp. NLR17b]MBX5268672.1 hypothetical protein [Rhizobium sp. NLR17b]
MEDSGIFLEVRASEPFQGTLVFEDDGRVAYAYLLNSDSRIVSDVWLYNRCPTPATPEWDDPTKAPFANSAEYVRQGVTFAPVEKPDEISVLWTEEKNGVTKALLFIRGEFHASMIENAKPGWSKLASKDGPIARALED